MGTKLNTPLSRHELRVIMRRFIRDKNRGISLEKFSELCGINKRTLLDLFLYEDVRLTEFYQRRVSSAYEHWKNGEVKIMRRPDATQYVDYRKVPEPPIFPHMGVIKTPDGFKLSIGPRNRHDYSYPTLDEQS